MHVYSATNQQILTDLGITSPDATVFIKQYGERRTGTNLVRTLLTHYFRNVFVLMHILGDKHSAPVDFPSLVADSRCSDDPAWHFVCSSTYGKPAHTTIQGDYRQLRYARAVGEALYAAYSGGRFGVIICTREPYDWAASLLRFLRWPVIIAPGSWDERAAADVLRTACHECSSKHRAWRTLYARMSPRALIVSSESLRIDQAGLLRRCQESLGLHRHEDLPFEPIDSSVGPTLWDYVESGAQEHTSFAVRATGQLHLTPLLQRVVHDNIDWDTMRMFGYEPRLASDCHMGIPSG